jgi:hypothetical protein
VLTYRLLVLVEGLPSARDSAPETGSLSSNGSLVLGSATIGREIPCILHRLLVDA